MHSRLFDLRIQIISLICLALLTVGCGLSLEQDPSETVNIEISGISAEPDRKEVQEALQGMTDGNGHSLRSNYSGNRMSISLSPVKDVDAFAKKIHFGTVTDVDVASRTVKVDFVP